jgi:hypothetical protein
VYAAISANSCIGINANGPSMRYTQAWSKDIKGYSKSQLFAQLIESKFCDAIKDP